MSLVSDQWLFLQDVAKLIQRAEKLRVVMTGGELYRTQSQQYLYYFGRKVTKTLELADDRVRSWTKNSKHKVRKAIDFNFFINGNLTYDHKLIDELGQYWESLDEKNQHGITKNGRKADKGHFQRN
jgi:hypothetical protein